MTRQSGGFHSHGSYELLTRHNEFLTMQSWNVLIKPGCGLHIQPRQLQHLEQSRPPSPRFLGRGQAAVHQQQQHQVQQQSRLQRAQELRTTEAGSLQRYRVDGLHLKPFRMACLEVTEALEAKAALTMMLTEIWKNCLACWTLISVMTPKTLASV